MATKRNARSKFLPEFSVYDFQCYEVSLSAAAMDEKTRGMESLELQGNVIGLC
jgi:hypothetical protein